MTLSTQFQWADAQTAKSDLVSDGWFSPDTYEGFYRPVHDRPAVYLFLLHKTDTYSEALVAYVGMSVALSQRLAAHNILPSLYREGYWPMRWFKPVPVSRLRETEIKYIRKFSPPWNVIGKPRGLEI